MVQEEGLCDKAIILASLLKSTPLCLWDKCDEKDE